jgi:hypothetical protein
MARNNEYLVTVREPSANWNPAEKWDPKKCSAVDKDRVIVTLWNMALGKKLWECPAGPTDKFLLGFVKSIWNRILISKDGIVAYVSQVKQSTSLSPHTKWQYMEVFFEGKKTWKNTFEGSALILGIIDRHIFTIGSERPQEASQNNAITSLFEWTRTGKLVKKISLAQLKQNHSPVVVMNDDFLVICSRTSKDSSALQKVFVLDHKTKKQKVFDLLTPISVGSFFEPAEKSKEYEISSRYLFGNHLYMGVTSDENPKILDFNLLSGEVEKEYPLKKKKGYVIENLVCDGKRAYFKLCDDSYCSIYSMDFRKGIKAKNYAEPILPVNLDSSSDLNLVLENNFLIASHTLFRDALFQMKCAQKILVDADSGTLLRKVIYECLPSEFSMSYQSGLFMLPNMDHHNESKFYIENFRFHEGKEPKVLCRSGKWNAQGQWVPKVH